ncbi:glycosyltransferase family 2 protein [Sulfurovum sp. NBC37-1]|uniref:glycosyltransferase family 2 protein n=1 Tax=Sulfurovum sp. (strain NBC37-1) TaxID=387093 RepID=UPI0001587BD9|nr:glycosyltransferase family 2 protein [Sulfurovum sp. NBC37-1]BAF73086.1 glycosyl transferase [Sulfurovum sp. NBC37-1]
MKKISIVTGCYNEEENVALLIESVKNIMQNFSNYEYEHIFIDNASEDETVKILRDIAQKDTCVKVIVNSTNFGAIRSGMYGLLQADGDAVISLVADFQDPPKMIADFIKKWEAGSDIVLAIKKSSQESSLMFKIRNIYYRLLDKLSEVPVFKNYTGFGLYDKKVIDAIRQMHDPYPFFRGMIAEVGYTVTKIPYDQPIRLHGVTKNNLYTLYDIGILGIINNSKVPLRIATFTSIILGVVSFFVGLGYLIVKLIYWDQMSLGIAPILIGASFAFSILLFFIGILGEYIGMIYTQVLNRPLVFEKERINFEKRDKAQ